MRLDPPSDRPARQASPADRPDESGGRNASPAHRVRVITPERQEEIRRRVLSGVYNGGGVIDEVARRLLASGDLSR